LDRFVVEKNFDIKFFIGMVSVKRPAVNAVAGDGMDESNNVGDFVGYLIRRRIDLVWILGC
jgi:hypothetical protein